MEMNPFPTAKDQIAAEAVQWFLRLQTTDRSQVDYQAFSEWLTRSPLHIEEYLAVSAAWVGLSAPDEGEFATDRLIADAQVPEGDNVVRFETARGSERTVAIERRSSRYRWRIGWAAIAASVLFASGAWFGYDHWYRLPVYGTAVGEQRSVSLSDGSVIVLNTHSEVRVRMTSLERRIELIRGEAQFHVAKNSSRPFWVSTSDAAVRAVGTVFNVRDDRSGTDVAVLEGRVEVSSVREAGSAHGRAPRTAPGGLSPNVRAAPVSIDLAAGQRAAVTANGVEREAGPTVEAVAGWTERRLVFRDERLADVVSEFNRYRVEPLIIDDSQLAELKISGVFDAADPESLVSYLRSFETVGVDQRGDGSLHLSRVMKK
jgi:transmembrane sensor